MKLYECHYSHTSEIEADSPASAREQMRELIAGNIEASEIECDEIEDYETEAAK